MGFREGSGGVAGTLASQIAVSCRLSLVLISLFVFLAHWICRQYGQSLKLRTAIVDPIRCAGRG